MHSTAHTWMSEEFAAHSKAHTWRSEGSSGVSFLLLSRGCFGLIWVTSAFNDEPSPLPSPSSSSIPKHHQGFGHSASHNAPGETVFLFLNFCTFCFTFLPSGGSHESPDWSHTPCLARDGCSLLILLPLPAMCRDYGPDLCECQARNPGIHALQADTLPTELYSGSVLFF